MPHIGYGSLIEEVEFGEDVSIGNYSLVRNAKIGHHSKIWHFCNLYGCFIGGCTQIGSYTQIKQGAVVGNYCKLQDGISIPEETIVGNHVFIGPKVAFANDKFPTALKTFAHAFSLEAVVVEDEVNLGLGAIISAGVRIGRGALVGAGSVVIKDVPAYSVVVGNPARIIGDVRDKKYKKYKIDSQGYLSDLYC